MKHCVWVFILSLCLPVLLCAHMPATTISGQANSTVLFTETTSGSPTLTISNVSSPSGAAVTVPITAANLASVGVINLTIAYDTAVAAFTGVANAPTGVTFTVGSGTPGVISLGWFDVTGITPLNITSGKLLDLRFTYKNGAGSISFVTSSCDLSNASGTSISGIVYQNGSLFATTFPTLTIPAVQAPAASGAVTLPITVTNFSDIGAVSLRITYDPAVVTYTGIAHAPAGVTFTVGSSVPGALNLDWVDATGNTPLNFGSGKLVDLNFTYIGGSGAVGFDTAHCVLKTGTGVVKSGITYQNGNINPGSPSTITGFTPASGPAGTAVTVTGTNFGTIQGTSTIKFGTTAAAVTSWSTTSITATVPALPAGSYTISVTTAPGTANSASQFTVTSFIPPTITISNVTVPAAGSAMKVPITVANLTSVGAITLKIAYDTAVVSFTGAANAPAGVTFTVGSGTPGIINLGWFDATGNAPINIASGKLVDLNFTYKNGTGSISFVPSACDIDNGTGTPISGITYQNGSLFAATVIPTLTIPAVQASVAGGAISVPITVTNFTGVGAVTLKISYDPAVVLYTGIANGAAGVIFTDNAASGVITLTWNDATGNTPLNIVSGKLVDLNFTYISGTGTVAFNTSQCELKTDAGVLINGIIYQNGNITSVLPPTITSFTPTSGPAGSAVTITGTNFGATKGTSLIKFGTVAAAVTSWSNTSITATVPALSAGSYTISVTTSPGTANSAAQFTVTTSIITISNAAAPATGAAVSLPITVANLTGVGAITLKIAYDTAVVTFTGIANAPTGVSFTANAANGVISLTWIDATGNSPLTIASGKLVDLNFTYLSGPGTCTFNTSQCEIKNGSGVVMSGITYQSGNIISTSTLFTLGAGAATTSGGAVKVPITVANLTNVGAITLKIAYDPAVVTFSGVANAPTGVTFTVGSGTPGIINLGWFDASGSTPLNITSGKLVDLNFTYKNGTGSISFVTASCDIANGIGTSLSGVVYHNGSLGSAIQNQKPTISPIPAITKTEQDTVAFVVSATDPNPGDVLTYTAVNLPAGAAFTAATRTFFWVPGFGQNGLYTVKFIVSDGQLADTANAVLTITKTNAKPAFTPIPALTKAELDTVKFIVSAADPNPGDVLTYSAANLPPGATFTPATRTFLWVPSLGQNGLYTVKFIVSDGLLADTANAALTITKKNVKPAFTPIPALTKTELDTVQFIVSATDQNPGDVLTYTAVNLPAGAAFTAATRTFFWVPSLGQNGLYTVKFIVSDGLLADTANAVLTITKTNTKPAFIPIPAVTKAELDTVKFIVNATDPNPGDVLTYTAVNLPAGAAFTAATHTFFWVPGFGQNGLYTVKFIVSDGQLADTANAVLTITKTNAKPAFTPIPALTKAELDTVKFIVSAADPNPGDVLTYSAANLPPGATFTPATRTFLWVPSLGQNGLYTVKFIVSDGLLADTANAALTITKKNVKPAFTPIPALTKTELDTVQFIVSATDQNPGDVLTYTAVNLPAGAAFTAATRTFFWVPSLGQYGLYTVKFIVSDGLLADTANAALTITKVYMIVKNPLPDMTLNDVPITNRTVKVKLTSPPVFANNIGVLKFTANSANTAVVSATIITPDTLQVKGLKAGGPVLVTVTAQDIDNSQLTDSIHVTVTGSTGVNEGLVLPTEFSLSQNYPNPFNPSTTISYSLPSRSHVRLQLINVLGQIVADLVNSEQNAGYHSVIWNAQGASGMYFYRFVATEVNNPGNRFTDTKKMILLK